VYLKEEQILPPLDEWLATAFAPDHLTRTLTALADSQPAASAREAADADARRELADCDRKLARHKAALEAGADPTLVTEWIREVQTERAAIHARLTQTNQHTPAQQPMTSEEIQHLVDTLGGLLTVLDKGDASEKNEIYRQLGLTLSYDRKTQTVLAEARPAPPCAQSTCRRTFLRAIYSIRAR
jgi:site-specific DNA recombinase